MGDVRKAAVGLFLLAGLLLFGVGLFLIGDRRRLFDESFHVNASFARLAGLQNGARVRVAGMDAGEVQEITVPASAASKFRVRMRILSELRPLVRVDSVATIQTDGLVGNKLVEIGTGSPSAAAAGDGDTIDSREPFELADLMQRANDVVATLDESVERLRADAEETLTALGETVERLNGVAGSVGRDLEVMTASARDIVLDAEAMVASVRAGEGTLGKLVNDDALYERSVEVARQVERMAEDAAVVFRNARKLSDEASALVESYGSDEGPAPGIMADLEQTVASAREAMSDMAENMESVKRSFLFRGMFQDRGFFDIDSLTLQEYLEGGIRDGHRSVRIWVAAADLFDNASDEVTLSELGKAKIDSAMREILRYPHNSPLMVEGYDDSGSLDERFLGARQLAFRVYDYIIRKYHRDPNVTAFMAMESLSPQNVDIEVGARERGVVLALFYDDDAEPAPRHRTIH